MNIVEVGFSYYGYHSRELYALCSTIQVYAYGYEAARVASSFTCRRIVISEEVHTKLYVYLVLKASFMSEKYHGNHFKFFFYHKWAEYRREAGGQNNKFSSP